MTAQLGWFVPGFPYTNPDTVLKPCCDLSKGQVLLGTYFIGTHTDGNGSYTNAITWQNEHPGAKVCITLDPWSDSGRSDAQVSDLLVRGASGGFDAVILDFIHKLPPALHGSYLRFMREMSGKWYDWRAAPNPAAWLAFFNRFTDLVHANIPEAKVILNWASTGGVLRGVSKDNGHITDILTAKADVFAVDNYDVRGNLTPQEGWDKRTAPELQRLTDLSGKYGKPAAVCELGLADGTKNKDGGDNPLFISGMHDYGNTAGVLYLSYQNGGWSQITGTKFPKAKQRFHDLTWNLQPAA